MTLLRNHGITAPAGFKASAVDGSVAVLVNEGPDLTAAGVFTGEHPTASMLWTGQVLSAGRLRAVLLHAGAAGAALSEDFAVTHRAAEILADTLSDWGTSTGAGEVAVCATGGSAPTALSDVVAEAVHELAGGLTGGFDAARAVAGPHVMPAQAALHHDDGWTVGGMMAGAGSMCVFSTDAIADAATLRGVLDADRESAAQVILLASGASEITCSPQELGTAVAAIRSDLGIQNGRHA